MRVIRLGNADGENSQSRRYLCPHSPPQPTNIMFQYLPTGGGSATVLLNPRHGSRIVWKSWQGMSVCHAISRAFVARHGLSSPTVGRSLHPIVDKVWQRQWRNSIVTKQYPLVVCSPTKENKVPQFAHEWKVHACAAKPSTLQSIMIDTRLHLWRSLISKNSAELT